MAGYCEFTIQLNRPVRHVERIAEPEPRDVPPPPVANHGPPTVSSLQPLLSAMASELLQWRSAHDEFAATFREAVVQLSLAIAERMVRQCIDADRYNLPDLLQEIWSRLDRGAAELFLNPADLQLLTAQHGEWLRENVDPSPVQLRADATLPRGTCRIEGQHDSFLAGVDVEFAGLAEWLKGDSAE